MIENPTYVTDTAKTEEFLIAFDSFDDNEHTGKNILHFTVKALKEVNVRLDDLVKIVLDGAANGRLAMRLAGIVARWCTPHILALVESDVERTTVNRHFPGVYARAAAEYDVDLELEEEIGDLRTVVIEDIEDALPPRVVHADDDDQDGAAVVVARAAEGAAGDWDDVEMADTAEPEVPPKTTMRPNLKQEDRQVEAFLDPLGEVTNKTQAHKSDTIKGVVEPHRVYRLTIQLRNHQARDSGMVPMIKKMLEAAVKSIDRRVSYKEKAEKIYSQEFEKYADLLHDAGKAAWKRQQDEHLACTKRRSTKEENEDAVVVVDGPDEDDHAGRRANLARAHAAGGFDADSDDDDSDDAPPATEPFVLPASKQFKKKKSGVDMFAFLAAFKDEYPIHAALLRAHLSAPMTEADVESIFSHAGRAVGKLRNRLGSELLRAIMFIAMNSDKLRCLTYDEIGISNSRTEVVPTSRQPAHHLEAGQSLLMRDVEEFKQESIDW
ncbi:hypothetical protein CTAYLR_008198 [Chrysophaeum taylorii]|uniref:HAT C-terminal dimerisation domain-containing protein n=1 Tax=Chrysophaeum taylorii TaxID=2483200 RepID=A0AAD7XIG2_9STRA|nr:hypothetical protein CTAYLR_008198 [Chrysophaeum taylorii]